MLTIDHIESLIASKVISTIGKKTTLCLLTLHNGFEVVGTASCVSVESYSEEIGARFAYQRALDKVWEVEGYTLQNKLFEEKKCCGEACKCDDQVEMVMNKVDPT